MGVSPFASKFTMLDLKQTQAKRTWLIILFLITTVLLFRFFPKAGYGLVIIALLVMLFKLKK